MTDEDFAVLRSILQRMAKVSADIAIDTRLTDPTLAPLAQNGAVHATKLLEWVDVLDDTDAA